MVIDDVSDNTDASHAMREKGGVLKVSLRAITLDSRELLPEPDMSTPFTSDHVFLFDKCIN